MSRKRFFCTSIFCLIFSSVLFPVNIYAESSQLKYREGELLVKFAPKSNGKHKTLSEKVEILSILKGTTVQRTFDLVPGLSVVELPSDVNVKDALKEFKKSNDFIYVEPNYKLKAFNTFPTDPCFAHQWGIHNTGQSHPIDHLEGGGFISGTSYADINAPKAWDVATDSSIIVAVIDSGIDYTHPDLEGNIWINEREFPGDGIDNDHNGYIDDFYGWDFGDDVGTFRGRSLCINLVEKSIPDSFADKGYYP